MNPQSPTLDFKPLHKGLGFHPFADGLPYAPQAPKPMPMPMPAPQIRGRRAGEIQKEMLRQLTPAPQAPVALPVQVGRGLGYLTARVSAFLIDLVFHFSVSALGLMAIVAMLGEEPWVLFQSGIFETSLFAAALCSWILMTAQEMAFGSSTGKRILGLRLQGSAASIFLRSFFFVLSLMFFGLGLFWALFNRERRCWHDVAADLQPT